MTFFGTLWRDHGTMLPQSASGACFRQAPGDRRERPVPLMSNSNGSQNGLRYRCGLCSARANRAGWTPGFSGCGCAAVAPEPGTDAAYTQLAPPHDRICLGAFSQNHAHIIQHIDAEGKRKSMRGGLPWGLGRSPSFKFKSVPTAKSIACRLNLAERQAKR